MWYGVGGFRCGVVWEGLGVGGFRCGMVWEGLGVVWYGRV